MQFLRTPILLTLLSWIIISIPVFSFGQNESGPPSDTLKVGDLCPDFNLENYAREPAKLSSLRGKYVYIDVWASWCYPCRKQFPYLDTLREAITSDELIFLGINLDRRDFRWIGTIQNLHVPLPQWHVLDLDFETRFNIQYIPRFIVLDKEGKILRIKMDAPSAPETKAYLTQLLNQ